jgi:NAD(P)H-flavin reductase
MRAKPNLWSVKDKVQRPTALARIASLSTTLNINIEGPYSIVANFPSLVDRTFDRILLVAGGVGATFILPLYEQISSDNFSSRVDLVWAVPDAAEVTYLVYFVVTEN